MNKQREEETDDLEAEPTPQDDKPEVTVRADENGQHVVDVPTESRGERRKRQRMEEMGGLVDSKLKPLMELLQQQRQAPVQQPVFQQPAPAAPQDETKNEWLKHSRRQEQIVSEMANSKDTATIEKLRNEWHDEEFEKTNIVARKHIPKAQPQEPPEFVILRTEFPDVLNAGPDVTRYASSIFNQEEIKARRAGKPFNVMDIHRKALNQAAKEFGIRSADPSPKPSETQRARFGGAGPASTGGNGSVAASRPLNAAEKKMALARYGKGNSPEKAYELWAKEDPSYFKDA